MAGFSGIGFIYRIQYLKILYFAKFRLVQLKSSLHYTAGTFCRDRRSYQSLIFGHVVATTYASQKQILAFGFWLLYAGPSKKAVCVIKIGGVLWNMNGEQPAPSTVIRVQACSLTAKWKGFSEISLRWLTWNTLNDAWDCMLPLRLTSSHNYSYLSFSPFFAVLLSEIFQGTK